LYYSTLLMEYIDYYIYSINNFQMSSLENYLVRTKDALQDIYLYYRNIILMKELNITIYEN